ncbi:hypothetical protein ACFFQW_04820 [Umezawaea endophytica]|uniref:Uncharacterized protein n=1 Tax=Umezawaea endophytica TaxID=1654476 RepID=A0A9X2ZZV6_9PSEU|nr:hypothetical protein [Umezawaea endophytica]MCS7476308.1 hypothetical protein [Umezawaea endophytica]
MTHPTTAIRTLRDSLSSRRAARMSRQSLERQLASYTTPSDRLDLDAMLDRHDSEDAAEIKAILHSQSMERIIRTGS